MSAFSESPEPESSASEPSPPPLVHTSLQRLRALLLGEGGLMASLVDATAGDGGGDGNDIGEAGGGIRDPARDGDGDGVGESRDAIQNPPRDSDGYTAFRDSPEGVGVEGDGVSAPAQIAASGPRAAGHREDYELLIETIYEGYLLHYGAPRVARTSDGDLALLAGDRLYALGLARLVALGDIAAVGELADTITLSALAQAAGAPKLAEAIWVAGARAIGWGSSDAHGRAKGLVLAGAPEAIEAMRTSAMGLAASP